MTSAQRHYNMSRIRGKDTKPEILVRKALHRRGFRYSVNVKRLPGTPDIVLAKYKTVIFVNGCFWHGHQGCKYYTIPKTNTEFWKAKIETNLYRDAVNTAKLESLKWNVITIWECELKKATFEQTIERVANELRANMANL